MRRRIRLALAGLAATALAATATAGSVLYAPIQDDVITVLLLGSDAGPPRGGSPVAARADGFHLLFVSPDRQHATFINVPRDAYVPVPGFGTTKINACLTKGPENCVASVEQAFGVQVDDWFVTSMLGFAGAIDRFGGVVVDVETPLYDGGPDVTSTGPQELTGGALTFARDRKNRAGGDFRRSEAQAEVLMAAHKRLVEERGTMAAVIEAAGILRSHSVTSASPQRLLSYGFAALGLPPDNVANVTLPGNVGTAGRASVVRLPERAYSLVRDAADDGRVSSEG